MNRDEVALIENEDPYIIELDDYTTRFLQEVEDLLDQVYDEVSKVEDVLDEYASMLFEGKNDQLTLTYEELRSIVHHAFNVGLNEGIECMFDSAKREKYLVDDTKGTFYQDKRND